MSNQRHKRATVLVDNPLEGEDALLDAMYGPAKPRRVRSKAEAPKPDHYKIVSISLYTEDIDRLDRMVRELKRRGVYKANKSQLIRHALQRLEADGFDERPGRDEF
ncbi:MAG: hypothetical protein AAF658_07905 [Myxococcota bacterium]